MKYSLVNGQRHEAQPNISGACPSCGRPMTAKCGELKAWHWAHQGKRNCDPWWENETEWHRQWKNEFPVNWQEVIQSDLDGVVHIADVKTDQGWVIEFQHSRISPEERRSRDGFYKKLVWVVDGTRLRRDLKQFSRSWADGTSIGISQRKKVISSERCAILKEWSDSDALVFIDVRHPEYLWWVHSNNPDGTLQAEAFSRSEFIKIHQGRSSKVKSFDALALAIGKHVESDVPKAKNSSKVQRLVPRHLSRRF